MSEEQTKPQSEHDEPKNPDRREAMLRMAKYTAPAMLALLVSSKEGGAATCIISCAF